MGSFGEFYRDFVGLNVLARESTNHAITPAQVELNSKMDNIPAHAVDFNSVYGGVEVLVYGEDDFETPKVAALLSTTPNGLRIDTIEAAPDAKGMGYGKAAYLAIARMAQENQQDFIVGSSSDDAIGVRERLFPTEVELNDNGETVDATSEISPALNYTPKSYRESEDADFNILPISERFEVSPNYSITPAQDAEYLKAVESGDTVKTQSMVDAAAKKAGYDSPKVYHGTREQFESFDPNTIGDTFGADEKGFFFAQNKKISQSYADYDSIGNKVDGGRVISAYLNFKNPLVIDTKFLNSEGMGGIDAIGEDAITFWDNYQRLILDEWLNDSHDGVIVVDDVGFNGVPDRMFVVFSPNQIKSSDPVTYDSEGNVIPLSQRFNSLSDSINL